ncbi:Nif3-like dinuclear metal center hexameric protein, partial [Bacteroidales bacterium AH-315-N07]|nr:Nif3-like dinuclear metal center hexameric protein [Bacteroidales bacterium AH-315-N07]
MFWWYKNDISMMKLRTITDYLETIAPLSLQEDYDNAGLIIGAADEKVSKVLLCLDCTEDIIEEAIEKKCDLVISHHPIIFKGLKKINGKNYVERVVIKAIQNNIAVYAAHTNMDN